MRRLLPLLALVQACAPPTSMVVEFTTNLPCPTQRTAQYLAIAYGGTEDAVENTFTEVFDGRQCDDQTGVLGTYVFRPLPNDREQTIFLKAALAPAGDVEAFCRPKEATFDARRCVFARRRIRFTPGATLRVPLLFHDSCLGKPCDVKETCVVGGRCVSKSLITPTCRPNETCVIELDGSGGGGAAGGNVAGGSATGGGSAAGGSAAGGTAGGEGGSAAGGSASGGSASGGSASGGSASGGSASGGSASGGSASGGSASGGSASGGSASGGTAAGGTAGASGGSAAGGTAGGSGGCNVYQRQFCPAQDGCCLYAGIDAGIGICSNASSCTRVNMLSGLLVRCIGDTDCAGQNCWVRDNQTLCIPAISPNTVGDRRTCTQTSACTSLGMPNCNPDPIFPFVRTCQCDPLNSLCPPQDVCSPATRQCVPRGLPSYPGLLCGVAPPGQSGITCLENEICCAAFDGCLGFQASCTGIRVGCCATGNCPAGSWCSYDRLSGDISSSCLNGIEAREGCDPTLPGRRCEGGGVCTGIIDGGAQNFGFCQ